MVQPRESNPRPPALQSNALPTELILPRESNVLCCCFKMTMANLRKVGLNSDVSENLAPK